MGLTWLDQLIERFGDSWESGRRPVIEDYLPGDLSRRQQALTRLVLIDLGRRLKENQAIRVESYLQRFPELAHHPESVVDLIQAEFAQRRRSEPALTLEEYVQRFPQYQDQLRPLVSKKPTGPLTPGATDTGPEITGAGTEEVPTHLGRHRVERILGKGSFGRVYLAYDDKLKRPVAIKVPHRKRVATPKDAETYLAEARVVASLDHPHIVPVHDVGLTEDGLPFVVSKFIEGSDLATKISQMRFSFSESARLVAAMAEALDHTHRKKLVHRDLKPGNILLDTQNRAYLADFGLALKEEDFGKTAGIIGTPQYMSPEQANGEGHLLDGRSDIFSLGVVFYELLTGRRPFRAPDFEGLLVQITTEEPVPPRQLDGTIPKELERICLKALAKRARERYATAFAMADDLQYWLSQTKASDAEKVKQTLTIVPKGLRSFDAEDADFFLEMLPGPRDQEGLPESIRFWKSRIEELDPDQTFQIGLIYGPSGCGKSSLVKAGLLPKLVKRVTPVYIEATGAQTEARLLKALHRQFPWLPGNLGLIESVAALRRGGPSGQKVLLVLDQFEQWLHTKLHEQSSELVQALRQCDGGRVQCIVMVRDDFWLAVSRFMKALEVEILEGQNSALVDLFDLLHARKVLAAFGRAYGRLPDDLVQCTVEQDAFLDQSVSGLAQDGKVISVRLALFAEMVKGKSWTPATLKEVGGTEGVGVTFLEENFAASTAPPLHRLHQKAAQEVLTALLPEIGTDIKGHMRSQQELLEASGYANRPKDFDDLLHLLDSELRLITPTDPEGVAGDEWRVASKEAVKGESNPASHHPPPATHYYQLTHDYLVHSLRDWLTWKQKETRRGRAELLLADRAAVWKARPENRQLPSLLQWMNIRWLTSKQDWTPTQRLMMKKAAQVHALRGVVAALVLTLLGWGAYVANGTMKAHALRDRLLDANISDVPMIVQDMAPYRHWLDPLLHDASAQADQDQDRRKQLHTSLALLPVDASQVGYLENRLLHAEAGEVAVIRDLLMPHQNQLVDRLWAVVETPEKGKESQRLRAGAALATYDPSSEKWAKFSPLIVNDLVQESPVLSALRTVR
jgi:serine/threonine protein kinase